MDKLTEAIREIERAARTLAPDQLRRARGNARSRVKRAVKKVLSALEQQYPAVHKPRGEVDLHPSAKRRRRLARRADLERRGWETVGNQQFRLAAALLAAGVKGVKLKSEVGGSEELWVPGWAYLIGSKAPDKLEAAAKRMTQKQRRALVTELTLLHGNVS